MDIVVAEAAAERVRAAARTLSEAIAAAESIGLQVEVRVHVMQTIGRPDSPHLEVKISQPV